MVRMDTSVLDGMPDAVSSCCMFLGVAALTTLLPLHADIKPKRRMQCISVTAAHCQTCSRCKCAANPCPAPHRWQRVSSAARRHPLVVADIEGSEGDIGVGDGGGLGRGADRSKVVADGCPAAQVLIHEAAHLAAVRQLALQGKG